MITSGCPWRSAVHPAWHCSLSRKLLWISSSSFWLQIIGWRSESGNGIRFWVTPLTLVHRFHHALGHWISQVRLPPSYRICTQISAAESSSSWSCIFSPRMEMVWQHLQQDSGLSLTCVSYLYKYLLIKTSPQPLNAVVCAMDAVWVEERATETYG